MQKPLKGVLDRILHTDGMHNISTEINMIGAIVTSLCFLFLVIANMVIYLERIRFVKTKDKALDMSPIVNTIQKATDLNKVTSESRHYLRLYEVSIEYDGLEHECKVFKAETSSIQHFSNFCVDLSSNKKERHVMFGGRLFKVDGIDKVYGDREQSDTVQYVKLTFAEHKSWFVSVLQQSDFIPTPNVPTIIVTF